MTVFSFVKGFDGEEKGNKYPACISSGYEDSYGVASHLEHGICGRHDRKTRKKFRMAGQFVHIEINVSAVVDCEITRRIFLQSFGFRTKCIICLQNFCLRTF